eukprot:TRINITY_DN51381_c0_g1_i1.p2 TRINITY_DN51381_c0_g1~~TRINITY_DN51381_c0_g1_i1.p2  ORF type:complete len:161 (+),score=29.12 TRINITY_DN51381_c0_g1_i1:46-483(+)
MLRSLVGSEMCIRDSDRTIVINVIKKHPPNGDGRLAWPSYLQFGSVAVCLAGHVSLTVDSDVSRQLPLMIRYAPLSKLRFTTWHPKLKVIPPAATRFACVQASIASRNVLVDSIGTRMYSPSPQLPLTLAVSTLLAAVRIVLFAL